MGKTVRYARDALFGIENACHEMNVLEFNCRVRTFISVSLLRMPVAR
jgi:hypothetical protein